MTPNKLRSRVLLGFFVSAALCSAAIGQSRTGAVALEISGAPKPLSLSLDDLRHMPRASVSVRDEHRKKQETYDGVSMTELLKEAGMPEGTQLRGRALATYVIATGADGYRVVFSIAELDPDFRDSDVIIADTLDGAPLAGKLGPLRLVAPHDKERARWVRMLRSIQIEHVP
jgi:DMSO/TMAO reductase YedYZ molybdopterin-dependent catalytic subunit